MKNKFRELAIAAALAIPLALTFNAKAAAPGNTVCIPVALCNGTQTSLHLAQNDASVTAVQTGSITKTGQNRNLDPGPIVLGSPWLLLGGLSLPLLWFLFRLTPPMARSVKFPPLGILSGLTTEKETPASLPLWHRVLRLTAASLIIGGLAKPLLDPETPSNISGPLLLVLDDGWTSAHDWSQREAMMKMLIDRAEREGRPVTLMGTALQADDGKILLTQPMTAAEARRMISNMLPLPWSTDHAAALQALKGLKPDHLSVFWLSDGIDDRNAVPLAQALRSLGALQVVTDALETTKLLAPLQRDGTKLDFTIRRPVTGLEETIDVVASDQKGHALDRITAKFAAGETETKATFDLPQDILNEIAQATVAGENTAGATALLDERWRRRAVGVLNDTGSEAMEPLLIGSSYASQALAPYVDLRRGAVDTLLQKDLSVVVVTDGHVLTADERKKLDAWVTQGGTLLRFAGPTLAQESANDDLLPLKLHSGARTLDGGAMAWNHPAAVAPFASSSPFSRIPAEKDVVVNEQLLPESGALGDAEIWASLEDGTPLVTAAHHGKGQLVLVHTTANADWSNLALSGMFVDMLRAIVAQSQAVAGTSQQNVSMPPFKILDGEGHLVAPGPTVLPLPGTLDAAAALGPQHPPGYYGNEGNMRSINIADAVPDLKPLGPLPDGITRSTYTAGTQKDMTGPLLAASLGLLLLDLGISLSRSGPLNGTASVRKRTAPGITPA